MTQWQGPPLSDTLHCPVSPLYLMKILASTKLTPKKKDLAIPKKDRKKKYVSRMVVRFSVCHIFQISNIFQVLYLWLRVAIYTQNKGQFHTQQITGEVGYKMGRKLRNIAMYETHLLWWGDPTQRSGLLYRGRGPHEYPNLRQRFNPLQSGVSQLAVFARGHGIAHLVVR